MKIIADEMSEDEIIVNSMKKLKIDTYITFIDKYSIHLKKH